MPNISEGKPETYINPVYPHSFPDPFVLKFRGEYFAYCTGDARDGNIFEVLRSRDLVNWTYIGSAMEPLASRPPFYWAPEISYDNGKFYLYYSAGNEILMEIRVAVSDRPDGGFVDAGVRLTKEEFAIDAHVFVDSDGSRYLFYATDFLEYAQIGTGTVVDRMIDWKTLAGDPRPVTRAKYDWQVYDPARKEKGGVRWHTVEGPTVIKRKGKYFEMFSGGNWQNKSYGVSFAITDTMNFSQEWEQFSDGEKILPILRTIPGKVVGPGHNSVVRGPNNRELYCIYHRWTDAGRVLAIDRMDFAGDRIFVTGPTTTEQPLPFQPLTPECLLGKDLTGWTRTDAGLESPAVGRHEFSLDLSSESFLFECTLRLLEAPTDGRLTIKIGNVGFELSSGDRKALLRSDDGKAHEIGLSERFDHSAWHRITIEKNGNHCRVMIDDISQVGEILSENEISRIDISSDALPVVITAIEVTPGFEELFESDQVPDRFQLDGKGIVVAGTLALKADDLIGEARASFCVTFADFALAANLSGGEGETGSYGLKLLDGSAAVLAQLSAWPAEMKVKLEASSKTVSIDLPDSFVGSEFRQFRLVCNAGRLSAHLDGILLSELPFDANVSKAAIYGSGDIAVEMVRLTRL